MKGKFIVIEGLEGAGKTTAKEVLSQVLTENGIKELVFTREPGGTLLAEKLRELLKQGIEGEPLTDKAEMLLMYAARIQLVENLIKPALTRGAWVIGDRHDLSSQAYQGGGRRIDASFLQSLRDMVLGDFYPDLTFYLDLPPEIGLARARQRGDLDRIERESLDFFVRARTCYLQLAQADKRIVTIDAVQSLEEVSAAIKKELQKWLQVWNAPQ